MSSPALEINRVRTIPLIVEREFQPMEVDEISGYPFDNSEGGDFHSKLDDIAKRHPEFAEHLGGFRKRSNSRPTNSSDDPEFRTRFTRPPFADRLADRFGFPFNSDDFEDVDKYAQQFYKPQREEFYQPQGSSTSAFFEGHSPTDKYQQPEPTTQTDQASQTHTETDNFQPSQERVRSNNIQQSNTTDLSQPQELINDRNQRSMSAPPVDKVQRSSQNKTTSTQSSDSEKMSHTENKSNERIIPIHIEGRDEPVIPKHVPPSSSSSFSPSQPSHHKAYAAPQPERIFGQRPEHFTQFINREPRQFSDNWSGGFAEEPCSRQQRYQPHQFAGQAPQPKEEIPIPVQRPQKPQEQQQQQRAASPHPQQAEPKAAAQTKPSAPQQQTKPLSPIEQIQVIQKEVSELMEKVHQFTGKPKDKEYLYLDEMLTRNLLKLDNIDTQGQDNIRSARKEAVRCIEKTISVLEAKAAAGVNPPPQATQENMDIEEKQQQPTETEQVDLENQSELQNTTATTVDQSSANEQPMETEVQDKKIDTTAESMEIVPESPAQVGEDKESSVINKNDNELVVENTNENTVVNNAEQQVVAEAATAESNESNISVSDAIKKFDSDSSGKNAEEKPNVAASVVAEEKCDITTSEVQDPKKSCSEEKENKKTKKKTTNK